MQVTGGATQQRGTASPPVSPADPLVVALKQRREQWGIARNVVARALSVSYRTLSAWEVGERQPSLSLLRRWAECLGLSLDLVDLMPSVDEVAVERATAGDLNPALLNHVERRLVLAKLDGRVSADQIAERAGMHLRTVQRVQRAIRKATKETREHRGEDVEFPRGPTGSRRAVERGT